MEKLLRFFTLFLMDTLPWFGQNKAIAGRLSTNMFPIQCEQAKRFVVLLLTCNIFLIFSSILVNRPKN